MDATLQKEESNDNKKESDDIKNKNPEEEFDNTEAAQNEKSSDDYWNVNSASSYFLEMQEDMRKIPENAMVDCMIQIFQSSKKYISHP